MTKGIIGSSFTDNWGLQDLITTGFIITSLIKKEVIKTHKANKIILGIPNTATIT